MGTAEVDSSLGIDVVVAQRPWEPAPAISNSFAFGGHNATILFVPA
jgi:3-oxoacyl-[acyl-carrier-protein] synthase II